MRPEFNYSQFATAIRENQNVDSIRDDARMYDAIFFNLQNEVIYNPSVKAKWQQADKDRKEADERADTATREFVEKYAKFSAYRPTDEMLSCDIEKMYESISKNLAHDYKEFMLHKSYKRY